MSGLSGISMLLALAKPQTLNHIVENVFVEKVSSGTATATTFVGALTGSASGNAATVTNGVYTNSDTTLGAGVDIETSTTGKIKQKGAFMQSSFHQSLVLGY